MSVACSNAVPTLAVLQPHNMPVWRCADSYSAIQTSCVAVLEAGTQQGQSLVFRIGAHASSSKS